jgi:glutaredoxin
VSVRVTLYSKPGCHLCEDVRAVLDDLTDSHHFEIEEIDITHDEVLFERYRYEIPVLLYDGEEVGRGRIREQDILTALQSRR